MPKKKTNRRTSWAAPYSQQADLLDLQLRSDYQHKLMQEEIALADERAKEYAKEVERAKEERKRFNEDPEGYLLARDLQADSNENKSLYETIKNGIGSVLQMAAESMDPTGGVYSDIDAADKTGKGRFTANKAYDVVRGNAMMQAAEFISNLDRVNYFKDFKNLYARRVNDFLIGEFLGYIDRATLFMNLLNGVRRSYEIEEEIENLRKSGDPNVEIRGLQDEYNQLEETRQAFNSYLPSNFMASIYQDLAGNGEDSWFSNNSIFGRTGMLHDELKDITAFLSSINSPHRSRQERLKMLDSAESRYNEKMDEWNRAIEMNKKDRESYGKVSDWFKTRADKAGTDFFDPNTYLFAMPGLLAGTTSGMTKTLPAMITGIGTSIALTAATVATGGLAAFLAGAATIGIGTTFGMNYSAGVGENNMEVAEAYSERLKDYLNSQTTPGTNQTLYQQVVQEGRKKLRDNKSSDEEIFEEFRRGKYFTDNVQIQKKMTELLIGIENQFQDDMAAVTWSSGLETLWQVMPIGGALGITKPLRSKIMRAVAANKVTKSAVRSEAIKNMAHGYEIAEPLGILPAIAYAPLHAVVAPTVKTAGKFGMNLASKIGLTTKIALQIPKDALKRSLKNETKHKYIKDIGGRWIKASIAEGIEEGKQHAASERYKSGEYTSPVIKSVWDSLVDDAIAGSKSALLIAGMPLEGFMSETDRRMLQEIKGGMLLGGGQTLIVNATTSIAPYTSKQSANDAILNTVFSDKLRKIDLFNKAKIYAEKAKSGSAYRSMVDAFDRLRLLNENDKSADGQYQLNPKHIDEEQKRFEKIAKIANDPYTIKQAASQGIKRGTKEFNEFVAVKAMAAQEVEDLTSIYKDAKSAFQQELQNYTEEVLTRAMLEISSVIPGQELDLNQSGPVLETASDDYMRSSILAEYAALLRRKQELKLGIENARNSKNRRIQAILNEQLSSVNAKIKLRKPVINKYILEGLSVNIDDVEDVEKELVKNADKHNVLTTLYKQMLLAEDDLTLANDLYERIVGVAYKDGKKIEDFSTIDADDDFDNISFRGGRARGAIKEVYDTINDDDDLQSAILQDFDERTDNEGNEVITLEEKEEIQETPPQNDPEEEFKEEIEKASRKPYITPSVEVRELQPKEVQEKPIEANLSPSEPVSPAEPTVVPETPKTSPQEPEIRITKAEGRGPFSRFELPEKYEISENSLPEGFDGEMLGVNELREATDGRAAATVVVRYSDGTLDRWDVVLKTKPTEVEPHTKSQQDILGELKRRAQLSKAKVKKVTPEYYLIEVGDELMQMPRVHSVMPKYWYGDGSYAAALQLGNAFDNLARQFFGDINNIALYEQNPDAFIEQWLDKSVSEDPKNSNSLNKTYRELYTTKEAFADTIKDLYELAKQYRDLGWALSTDKIVWYSQFASGYVAGETDMVAVDRNGDIHIIDFKTAKGLRPFQTFVNDDVYRTTKYADLLGTLTESDFKAGPKGKGLSKAAKAVKRKIREAEGSENKPNRNIMLEWNGERAVLKYADSEFSKIPARMLSFRKGPKSAEYSDQLTAYAEMIQKQLANVIDLEVAGFRTQYTTDSDNNLVQVLVLENLVNEKPFRIKVSFSDEMRGILNTEAPAVEPVEKPNKEAVEAKENNLADSLAQKLEAAAADKHVPSKSEDSLKRPNEPDNSEQKNVGFSNINPQIIERDQELAKLTASPDFINECVQKGLVEVYTDDERSKGHHDVYVNITYNGKTYKGIHVWANEDLYNEVKNLERSKKEGQKIIATTLKRTAGKISYRKDGKSVPLTDTSLLSGVSLQDIEFTPESGHMGMVSDGDVRAYKNGDVNQPTVIFTYKGTKVQAPADGSIIFVKNPNHKENPNEAVPVGIKRKTFKDSADFIIKCLREINTIGDQYVATINGEQKAIGVTKKSLLSLLMPIVTNIDDAAAYSLMRDPQNPSVFHIVVRGAEQPIFSVNMLDQQSVDRFKQFLSSTDMPLHNRVLVSRIGSNTNKTPQVFKDIKKFFGQNAGVSSLVITSDIKFDRSDILGDGLSGLGWYIKNGRLITNYDDIVAPIVSIGGVGYFDEAKTETPIDQVKPVEELAKPDDSIDISFFLPKRLTQKDENKPKLTPEQIKKNLRPILGDEVDNPTVIEIITKLSVDPRFENAAVVGLAHKDGLRIYGAAFEGVEYHEAFHRIFELFVPRNIRDKIYNQIAKELGLDLAKDSEENDYFSHRLVAEHVADAYMDYKGREFNTRFNWLNRVLNKIRDIVNVLFHISDRQMYKVFMDVNSGKYRSERRKPADIKDKERFEKMFKELNYEVHGREFKHIINDPMYEDAKNTAFYCIMLGQKIDLSGKNVSNTKINRATFMRGADRLTKLGYDIFGTTVEPTDKTVGLLAMSELYINFEAISDDIAAMFAAVSTDYKKVRQDETQEDLDGDEVSIASAWDENFFKWDYEFSRFDKASSRIKYFFASIPDMKYDELGRPLLQRNSLGMPQMLSMKYVFNEVLSALWDIDTLDELVGRVRSLAKEDPMWTIISKNIQDIINTREGDADKEALLTQLMNTIRSNRHTFMLTKAVVNTEGLYTINMLTSDADYNAREYPIQWSQVLSKGGSDVLKVNENGQLVFNPKNQEAAIAFQKIARLFDFSRLGGNVEYVGLKQMLSEAPSQREKVMVLWDVVGSEEYQFLEYSDDKLSEAQLTPRRIYTTKKVTNLNDPVLLKKVKDKIIEALNAIGINIHIEEFDYMLKHKYGSTDTDALRQMVNSTDETDSMSSFLYFLNTISNAKGLNIQNDGTIFLKNGKRIPFENVYENLAFVKELGNWKYQYRHAHDELTVLATGGNRFYEMSDNDLFSDTLRALNKRGQWFEDLKQDPYNYSISSQPDANGEYLTYGSYTLDQLVKNPELKLQLRHLIGFKTDKKGDEGQDYFEISRREDYLSKVQILESGGILSLTLSDKKKYVYIQGIKLPGLDYSDVLDNDGNPIPSAANAILKTHSPKDGGIDQLDSVVTQFLSYAISEYESIKSVAEKNIDVKNFKEQGKRFSSLLGIWEDVYDKDGNWTGEQFISFNDGKKSWEENLGIAEAYFFDRTEEEQKALIKRNLNKILDKELATAEELGLIRRSGSNENIYLNYKNVGLNTVAIQSLSKAYMDKYPGCSPEIAESIAVVVYLNDISNKALMSGQEMERLMSGNPAFYKWKYNDRGELVDRTVDELKRLGGLGSTGTNNFLELSNLPEKYKDGKYRCAEVDNEMTASPLIEMFRSTMYAGELRQNIIYYRLAKEEANLKALHDFDVQKVIKDRDMDEEEKAAAIRELKDLLKSDLQAIREQITQEVDNSSIEQLEDAYKGSEVLNLSKEKAKVASESLAGKIDVADGGAYITDEMCETLLRMEGSWSKEIEEAFDILRGRKKADYLGKSEAYQKVLTTVIGNLKYTAFGRRLLNGVSVPYYHKMALFPIFECIATGKMSNIFDKMKEQGIDMLLINSAVKVGSEGSKSINWSEFREDSDEQNANNFFEDGINGLSWKPTFKETFNFNTYDVDFTYLRKQLNTDPNEEEMLRMGTQAQKIVFSNLFQGRMYKQQSGEEILGQDLQNRIMKSLNALSDMGVKKLNKRFFVTNENGDVLDENGDVLTDPNSNRRQLDIEKFAKEVSKLMSDRGADKNILKALEVVSNNTDDKQLTIPLGAISNASWLESVLISTINKDVIDVNTPGAFFIQRSVWAMQGKRMYSKDKGDILGRQIYNGQRLLTVNEEGSMDCVLSLDYFEHILPKVKSGEYELDQDGNYTYERDENGRYKTDKYGNYIAKQKMREMSFDEARQWLLDNGIIGGKANIVAYRIPTQAESSIHALRCVDVLPVVRDTVILPEEFTKITGSDFD